MNAASRILSAWWTKSRRSTRDVERDIDDEIAFHLESAARELEAEGLSLDEARAEARRRFGNVEAITRECRRTGASGRIFFQSLSIVAIVVLTLAVVLLLLRGRALEAASQEQVARLHDEIARLHHASAAAASLARGDESLEAECTTWLEALQAAAEWRAAARLADRMTDLEPARSTAILERIFAQVDSTTTRSQVLKAFAFQSGRPNALSVIRLGLLDPDAGVRSWARGYLHSYAWRGFDSDAAALEWTESHRNDPLESLLESGVSEFFAEPGAADAAHVETKIEFLLEVNPQVLESHAPNSLESTRRAFAAWLALHSAGLDSDARERALAAADRHGVPHDLLPSELRILARKKDGPR